MQKSLQWHRGWMAQKLGSTRQENPYKEGSQFGKDWLEGYEESEND